MIDASKERDPVTTIASARNALRQGQFAAAQQLASQALELCTSDQDRIDALYMVAVSQRYQRHYGAALRSLKTLRGLAPDHARAWQEVGHIHFTLDQFERATTAYEMAVTRNPTLLASWKALTNLYDMQGRVEQARKGMAHVKALAALPPELLSVKSLMHEGKFQQADQLCRHFLRQHKHHAEGLLALGEIGVALGMLDDAEFVLESGVELNPDHFKLRFEYANVLLKRQKFQKAYEQAVRLAEVEPGDLATKTLLASANAGIGNTRDAIGQFDEVLRSSQRQPAVWVMRGHAQKTIGDFDAAIKSYRRAYEVEASHGDAFWSLANTKVYTFTDDEIEHMRIQEQSEGISEDDRIHMCFALGKALEDRSEFAASFEMYERGNSLKHKDVKHHADMLARRVEAQRQTFQPSFLEHKSEVGHSSDDPVFIVGLPRAGSTLLEQILASHSMVDGTLELPHILSLVNRLRSGDGGVGEKPAYPAILRELSDDYFARFGQQYIAETQVFRQGAPHFIDKMPNNFFHLGLIKMILPRAKVIDARRHPMSCCFSGFKQLFGEGQEFTYGLESIGNYYRQYVELMDHWNAVLPGFILTVQHEEVVDDLEGQVRRILEFCKLPFEENCLRFFETDRNVRTPSSEQVRQPIYRTALEHWRHYEPWLGPLIDALGPAVRERYGVR